MKSFLFKEEWRDITGYEGLYQVSNLGRVKSVERYVYYNNGKTIHYKERILKLYTDQNGYKRVGLRCNGKHYLVHRLVAEAFIPNPDNKPCIDHINTCPWDNTVWNLKWCTSKENQNNPLTLKRLKVANVGRRRSDEFKQKVSTTMKNKGINIGTENPMYNKYGKEHPQSKPVLQYDLNGNFIREWECARQINRELGIQQQNIGKCCLGKRPTAGGYVWKFKNNELI
jgi:hypothetical protein